MDPKLNWLQNSGVILDIETLGLERGSGMHQIATYNIRRKHVDQFYVSPNLQIVTPATPQDVTRLASSPLDIIQAHPGLQKLGATATWPDVIIARSLLNRGTAEHLANELGIPVKELIQRVENPDPTAPRISYDKVRKALETHDPFLSKAIESGDFHYFLGTPRPDDKDLAEAIRKKSKGRVQTLTSYDISPEDVLKKDSAFMQSLKGEVIWIASAEFEAKQFGAQKAAEEKALRETAKVQNWTNARLQRELRSVNPLREIIQGTSTTTAETLYVTGKEFLKVRRQAKITGDWSKVFRATLEHTQAGDVRDVADVVKAQQSYLQKLGFLRGTHPGHVSMDVQARLYAYSAADSPDAAKTALEAVESHIAREDTGVTEDLVRRHSLAQTAALEAVHEGTDEGRLLLAQAREGKGVLYQALRYAQAYEAFEPELERTAFGQRLGRMFQDFAAKGETVQTTSMAAGTRAQYMPDGRIITVDSTRSDTERITNIDEAISRIVSKQQHAVEDRERVAAETKEQLIRSGALRVEAGETVVNQQAKLELEGKRLYEESRVQNSKLFADAARMENEVGRRLMGGKIPTPRTLGQRFAGEISEAAKTKAVKGFGMFAAATTGLGLIWSLGSVGQQRDGPESLRTINYAKWLEAQKNFSGSDTSHMQRSKEQPNVWEVSGLAKGGIAHTFRSQTTDFGSPYVGPEYSNSVFGQTDLLRKRERYLQSAFNAVHYDSSGRIGKYFDNLFHPYDEKASFRSRIFGNISGVGASRRNHSFLPANAYRAVPQGKYPGLKGDGLLEVNLRSGKWDINVPDADTITLDRQGVQIAKFRLSGIDAPETAHGGRPGQPYAIAGKLAARQMIENAQNLSLVVDPTLITYGRTVGTLVADGKNLNLEFVKRGIASYLPFKNKGKEEMFNQEAFAAASKAAMASDKGMWKSPFFQVYRDILQQSDTTITFNTLANPTKVASNSGLLSLSSIMQTAQHRGSYTSDLVEETAELASRIKAGSRKVAGRGLRFGGAEYKSGAWKQIHTFSTPNSPHKTYMSQMVGELSQLLKTRGKADTNPNSAKKLGRLDKVLSIDSTQAGSLESKRQLHLNKILGTRNKQMYYNTLSESLAAGSKTKQVARQIKTAERRERMAAEQRAQNQAMFNSPINHQRM